MSYIIRPVSSEIIRNNKTYDRIFYEVIFDNREQNHGYAELLFYKAEELLTLKYYQELVLDQGLNKEDKVSQISRFFPNGKVSFKDEEVGKQGVGTELLKKCIQDAKDKSAKILFIMLASDKLCDYLEKRNFTKVTQFGYFINLETYDFSKI